MSEVDVEYVPVKALTPYLRNPRKNDAAVDSVVASIRTFGFRNPIILDRHGIVVSGHTRLKAAKKLGMETVPVVRAEDLSDEQAAAFRLADNKVQELSSWDFGKLMDELTAIDSIDMTQFGFESAEEKEKVERRRESEGGTRQSNLDDGYEIDVGGFEAESFTCTCPECGFRFNENK